MNPLIRRRLPPSVRSLLTDIGPKEEWTDTEPETETRDGILIPSRRPGQEEFLTPAMTQEQDAAEEGRSTKRSTVCMLCKCKPSCYTCPRCNLQYCGLACYQSPDHAACSEEFYKESVLQELKEMGKTETEGRKKMEEILVGLRQQAEKTHGGMEGLLKEVGIVQDDTEEGEAEATEKVQVVELLSRLAELQQAGDGGTAEIEAILEKLEEIGGEELLTGETDEEAEGADEKLDLADRLSGLDIDKLSEEELWELLSSKEKEGFMDLMKGGALGGLVPLWKPWWEEHEDGGKALVEVLEEEVNKLERQTLTSTGEQSVGSTEEVIKKRGKSTTKLKNVKGGNRKQASKDKGSSIVQNVPPISAKIPKLSSLCANPSSLLCYGVVNALFGYSFTLCLFNGDTDSLMFEFCDMILALSEALNSNRVFNSVQEALDCGETLILSGGYLDKEDPLAPTRAVEAVAHIMTGRDRKDATGYCLAALSQLRAALSQARTALSKDGEEGVKRQKYFLASKKCEFFQAWVLDNAHQVHRLAIELWSEHSKRESVRSGMEKAKTVVEDNLKKAKRKEKTKLIEELS
ncbi:zinc finger HIT domain-containing protein 2 [Stegastes partitus]|uniref:Zinc finger HIT domain-containing protein 2 n=1 Tax=Stegastes partitus TaxID=144197 RepID=A0A3B4Z0A8_9TELE|nr:PREDICTED: zinc finger HIT domain-containing protein 2 [Stegastes partitus]XP_008296300.1 PREDICTED: zinc finger HIT domain-containing protein 2 [Stegastes partitus]